MATNVFSRGKEAALDAALAPLQRKLLDLDDVRKANIEERTNAKDAATIENLRVEAEQMGQERQAIEQRIAALEEERPARRRQDSEQGLIDAVRHSKSLGAALPQLLSDPKLIEACTDVTEGRAREQRGLAAFENVKPAHEAATRGFVRSLGCDVHARIVLGEQLMPLLLFSSGQFVDALHGRGKLALEDVLSLHSDRVAEICERYIAKMLP